MWRLSYRLHKDERQVQPRQYENGRNTAMHYTRRAKDCVFTNILFTSLSNQQTDLYVIEDQMSSHNMLLS